MFSEQKPEAAVTLAIASGDRTPSSKQRGARSSKMTRYFVGKTSLRGQQARHWPPLAGLAQAFD